METTTLQISNVHASVQDTEILKGLSLEIKQGEVHAIMGPNGSGKSTLSHIIMGHPDYEISEGKILFEGQDIAQMSVDERSRNGIFLSFQYPQSIPGVTVANFLRAALNARKPEDDKLSPVAFNKILDEKLALLHIDKSFAKRYINDGFSGGEKKRMEILQLALLEPKLAILDETDSGTDVDALKIIADGVNKIMQDTNMTVLLITHYDRILQLIHPNTVSILVDGKIVKTADANLASYVEQKGYSEFM